MWELAAPARDAAGSGARAGVLEIAVHLDEVGQPLGRDLFVGGLGVALTELSRVVGAEAHRTVAEDGAAEALTKRDIDRIATIVSQRYSEISKTARSAST